MPRLKLIRDGYTLPFTTSPTVVNVITGEVIADNLPTVSGTYRPPTWAELEDFRVVYNDSKGAARVKATAEFVAGRIKTWDVEDGDKAADITPANVEACGDLIGAQLRDLVSKWGAKPEPGKPEPDQGQAEGN